MEEYAAYVSAGLKQILKIFFFNPRRHEVEEYAAYLGARARGMADAGGGPGREPAARRLGRFRRRREQRMRNLRIQRS